MLVHPVRLLSPRVYSPLEPIQKGILFLKTKTYVKRMLGTIKEKNSSDSKVLGVHWNPMKDALIFDLTEIANFARDLEPTKRNVVSVAAKFYDPFGFLSPVVIEFKLFFQELCRMKIGWDDPLNDELLKMWGKLLDGLEGVTALSLSRCYFQGVQERVVSCSLHGFVDAFSKAYPAVIYLHVTTPQEAMSSLLHPSPELSLRKNYPFQD